MTAAQASRNQTAPKGPTWPNSGTDRASPSWTRVIEPTAIRVPARAARAGVVVAFMEPVHTSGIVHVHVRFVDIPFSKHE